MGLPAVHGVIARRLLVNYRVAPDAIASLLPKPFRPKLVGGNAVAGICLIRLSEIRPRGMPAALGHSSENAAHRIAVEWEQDGKLREGVFIPRRDTNSRLNTLLGGRLFPGVHHLAQFTVLEEADRFRVALQSADAQTRVEVSGQVTTSLPANSVFGSIADASTFFESGAIGYSATKQPNHFHGLELRSLSWNLEPLAVDHVTSSFFEDASRFSNGAAAFDSAFVMRGIRHEWHALPPLC
jgi:hypothetical protein